MTDDECAILLDRCDTVLDELFAGQDVHVITVDWTAAPGPPAHPGRWATLRTDPGETDPEFVTRAHLCARRVHPYDGGADVILASPEERDRLRERHADWLSKHPMGL